MSWLKKEILVEKNTAECKERDFRITSLYLLTVNSSLGLYKPWSTLLSPSIICSLDYYLAVRVGLLVPTSHLGGAAVRQVGQLARTRHHWKQNPQLENHSPIFHPGLHWVQASQWGQRLLSSTNHCDMVVLATVLKMNHVKCSSHPLWTLVVKKK